MTFVGVFPSQAVFDHVWPCGCGCGCPGSNGACGGHYPPPGCPCCQSDTHTPTSRPNLKISQGCIPAVHHWWKLARDVRPPQSLYAADFTMDFFQERFPFVDGCTTGPSWLFFSLSKTHQKHELASPLLKDVLEQRQRNILRSFSQEGRYDSLGVHRLEYPVLSSSFELIFVFPMFTI